MVRLQSPLYTPTSLIPVLCKCGNFEDSILALSNAATLVLTLWERRSPSLIKSRGPFSRPQLA